MKIAIILKLSPLEPSVAATQDHIVENLIIFGIAGFILLVFGILLLEAWLNQSRH